jgi:hypothetical protein
MTLAYILSRAQPVQNGCINLGNPMARSRYWNIHFRGKIVNAHRVVWTLAYGEIPPRLCVLHKCDNTRCINPDHLELGTQKKNMRDCVTRGRKYVACGEQCRWAKLTEETVLKIRSLRSFGWSHGKIARLFGIKLATVAVINQGKRRKHLLPKAVREAA